MHAAGRGVHGQRIATTGAPQVNACSDADVYPGWGSCSAAEQACPVVQGVMQAAR
jgi:hypothetical protein